MADVFISYAQGDREWVKTFATALETEGFSVWWDPNLLPGSRFREIIKNELANAKAVIVVWSHLSAESDWVLGEADEARALRKLVPLLRESLRIPTEFRSIHTSDLSQWRGQPQHPEFRKVVSAIRGLAAPAAVRTEPTLSTSPLKPAAMPSTTQLRAPTDSPQSRATLNLGKIALGVLFAILAFFVIERYFSRPPAPTTDDSATVAAPEQQGSVPSNDKQMPSQSIPVTPAPTQSGYAKPRASRAPATAGSGVSSRDRNATNQTSIDTPPTQNSGGGEPQAAQLEPGPAQAAPDPETLKEQRIKELEKAWANPH
jgi:hypothetical protein